MGCEQPGPGATLLGWPKSIYYFFLSNSILQMERLFRSEAKEDLEHNVASVHLESINASRFNKPVYMNKSKLNTFTTRKR